MIEQGPKTEERRSLTEHRAHHRRRRVAWAGAITCLAIALLALMMWAQRPRWRTYTFPRDPRKGIAVAIDYPDDWMLDSHVDHDDYSVQFRPLEPNSLLKWCREHFPGNQGAHPFPTTIQFAVSRDVPSTIDELESSWLRPASGLSRPFDSVQVMRRQLPAGPTLDIVLHLTMRGPNGIRQRRRSHEFTIFLASQNRDLESALIVDCFMPEDGSSGLDARLQEAMRRVRVVHVAEK
jgi:hypothetical protein